MPPPSFNPNEVRCVFITQYGGEVGNPAAIAPRIAPLGLAPKKVGDDIAKQTQDWKGIKITIRLSVANYQATIDVIPTTTALIIKGLKEPPRDRKKTKGITHSGNLTLEEIITIARTIRETGKGIPAKTFKGTVKEVLGTCNAVGCTVGNKKPTELQQLIEDGEVEVPED